ncbi:hypothetical protein [Microbacterium sp. P02]|uniref:hypothetical protein n=1 Tax=Microbacterium sp. P02 TaxID=3366260 RepID=UPI00367177B0
MAADPTSNTDRRRRRLERIVFQLAGALTIVTIALGVVSGFASGAETGARQLLMIIVVALAVIDIGLVITLATLRLRLKRFGQTTH